MGSTVGSIAQCAQRALQQLRSIKNVRGLHLHLDNRIRTLKASQSRVEELQKRLGAACCAGGAAKRSREMNHDAVTERCDASDGLNRRRLEELQQELVNSKNCGAKEFHEASCRRDNLRQQAKCLRDEVDALQRRYVDVRVQYEAVLDSLAAR
jgi:hypothetical protein